MGTWIEIARRRVVKNHVLVVPYVGTWIEIISRVESLLRAKVVPYVGTWIEMVPEDLTLFWKRSFPTWERG